MLRVFFGSPGVGKTTLAVKLLCKQRKHYQYCFGKIGPWTICRRVYKRTTVDKQTQQIIDGYKKAGFLTLLFPWLHNWMCTFRPFYYRRFDSWDAPDLPVRSFGLPLSNREDTGDQTERPRRGNPSGCRRSVEKLRQQIAYYIQKVVDTMRLFISRM